MKLQDEKKITRTKSSSGKMVYCLRKLNFEINYKEATKFLERLDVMLARHDVKKNELMRSYLIGEFLTYAYRKYVEWELAMLYNQYVTGNKQLYEYLQNGRNRLWDSIEKKVYVLKNKEEITRIIDSLSNPISVPDINVINLKLDELKGKKIRKNSTYIPHI